MHKLYIYLIYIWKRNMTSYSNETLHFSFRKFCFSYILDLAKTVWALRIFSQKFTANFVKKELWALENHVLVICYFTPVIAQRYIKYTLVHSSKHLVHLFYVRLFRRLFRTAIFSRFSKRAIVMSNFLSEFYNCGFEPEFSVLMQKKPLR